MDRSQDRILTTRALPAADLDLTLALSGYTSYRQLSRQSLVPQPL
jgi:hypothetical protein